MLRDLPQWTGVPGSMRGIRSPSTDSAAALSFMRAGPYDVRPALLQVMFGQDVRALEAVLSHGCRYLRAWCERMGEARADVAIEVATVDALSVLCRRRAPMTADDRARSLRMRASSYRALRNVALSMYKRRLQEACAAYKVGKVGASRGVHESCNEPVARKGSRTHA